MNAARRTEERVYIFMRQEGRKKGFKYVGGKKDGGKDLNMYAARRTVRRDLHMYAARRTEEWFKYVCGKKDGRKDLYMCAARRTEERI